MDKIMVAFSNGLRIYGIALAALALTGCKMGPGQLSAIKEDVPSEALQYGAKLDDDTLLRASTIAKALGVAPGDRATAVDLLLPGSMEGWIKIVQPGVDVATATTPLAIIPFSLAPGATNLSEPRLVVGGTGDLGGRLFIGAIPRQNGARQEFEFISWNDVSGRFDFGLVDGFGTGTQHLRILAGDDAAKCFACHKAHAPIFQQRQWSSTLAPPLNLYSFVAQMIGDDEATYGALKDELASLPVLLAQVKAKASEDAGFDEAQDSEGIAGSLPLLTTRLYHGLPLAPAFMRAQLLEVAVDKGRFLLMIHTGLKNLPDQSAAAAMARGDADLKGLMAGADALNALPEFSKAGLLVDVHPAFGAKASRQDMALLAADGGVNQEHLTAVKTLDANLRTNGAAVAGLVSAANDSAFGANPGMDRLLQVLASGFIKLSDAFRAVDPPYQTPAAASAPAASSADSNPCATCHAPHGDTPATSPAFGTFNPTLADAWTQLLAGSTTLGYATTKPCFNLKRVLGQIDGSAMPPNDYSAVKDFRANRQADVVAGLKQVVTQSCPTGAP